MTLVPGGDPVLYAVGGVAVAVIVNETRRGSWGREERERERERGETNEFFDSPRQ